MDGINYESEDEDKDELVEKLDQSKNLLNVKEIIIKRYLLNFLKIDNKRIKKEEKRDFLFRKEKINEKIKNIIDEFDLKTNPHLYKEDITSDLNKLIYDPEYLTRSDKKSSSQTKDFFGMEVDQENSEELNDTKETSDGNDIFDCSKYNKKPEFDIDFLIKTVKKRFVTGSNFEDTNINIVDEQISDDEKELVKKSKPKGDNRKGESIIPERKWTKKGEEQEEDEQIQTIQDDKKAEVNLIKEFCNEEFGIYEKGKYVRIDIKKIKKKYVDNFSIDFPIVLCTTNLQENSFGYLKIKFTKHLWHPKILKNNDPIILSIGWRKFQVTPVYCIEEKNHRLRMIKYTPKYTSCYAIVWGPLMPINVSVVAIQNYSENVNHFRICGTGDLVEINQNFEINKKLKLIGEPLEIYKKTAFIKGMFNSNVIFYKIFYNANLWILII